ncbi:MAG: 2-oxoacid:acceptor oxidoreductase family protein [Desulfosalsimonas sp.]
MRDKKETKNGITEVVLAGSGGQGLISSGIMLGEAAILEDKNVMQSASYGIAQRGGLSIAEVIISDSEILFQHVESPDIVLALTEESVKLYEPLAEKGVPVFYDTMLAEKRAGDNFYGYHFTEMAGELGHSGMANVIALGAMAARSGMIKAESLEEVLRERFAGESLEMNIKALYKGVGLVSG